ncbi:hypothetical protein MIND_00298200 [Mycena indigotica]|uniref:AB hydrolase-1 domain-containing protein n=1 Tax=Mycena indigotica TaxID=2126181 RepID=A0A8H6WEB0_9AGAR|nr:uncharacterized protein MIND_00298200 [Mycena indigotica]KAF7309279.1 hypothetical protein MIND_00298200 [Mycena indigotica]
MTLLEKQPLPPLGAPVPSTWPAKAVLVFAALLSIGILNTSTRVERRHTPLIGTVTWSLQCERPGQECGQIVVPKDYLNPSSGSATIFISRVRATQTKKGTVFVNPGGPGVPGTWGASPGLAQYLANEWDIVGFDPRGIHRTIPQVKCFPNSSYALFKANTVLEQSFTLPFSSKDGSADPTAEIEVALERQMREFVALKKAEAAMCAENVGEDLKYMGTTTVVRDLAFMADVLDGEGSKINLFTGSYGSIIGAYLVNMLPDRAGRVVIDGIVDPMSWSSEPAHKWPANWLASTEKTYRFFLEMCAAAGPLGCPIAQHTSDTPVVLEERLEEFFDSLARAPMPVIGLGKARAGYLTSGAARALVLMYLEQPTQWSSAAHAIGSAIAGNGTLLHNFLVAPRHSNSPYHDLARSGVTCADQPAADSHNLPTSG